MHPTLFDDFADDDPDDFDDEAEDEPPARIEIHGRLFMRSGGGLYTNIEDADDDRIFEFDPETGELTQWPDHD
ncbi:MAG: hypothetical protein ACJ8F7_23025 [Gemmataceae bacterium]